MGYRPVTETVVRDRTGKEKMVQIVNEYPLTIILNKKEIVTLMSLGSSPEDLVLGYLKNQGLLENASDILSVSLDRDREAVLVLAKEDRVADPKGITTRKIVTTGCGEGTVFSCNLDKIYERQFRPFRIRPSEINNLCAKIAKNGEVYRLAGSVHTCALCTRDRVLMLVEDVGRHNAADTIAGKMLRTDICGTDKILYTTGRITSEIVLKSALMEIPVLLSRSGVTQMGLEIARDLNMIVVARAKAKNFLVYTGHDHIDFI